MCNLAVNNTLNISACYCAISTDCPKRTCVFVVIDVNRKRPAWSLSSTQRCGDETNPVLLWEQPRWILHWIYYSGDFVPFDPRKGQKTTELISRLPRVKIKAQNMELSSSAWGPSCLQPPTTVFPVSCVTNNIWRSSSCNFPKLDEDEFRVLVDALFIVIILSLLSVDDTFEFKGKDEEIEQRVWITHSGKMALYLFLNV